MGFEQKYSSVDRTSSKYRDRVMIEVTDEMREILDEFIKRGDVKEAKACQLATIWGLRHLKNNIGYDEILYLCDRNRARK